MGWFWYLGLLVPVIGLLQVGLHSLADRYTYLPSIGLFLLVVWSLPLWLFTARLGRLILGLATANVVILLWASTWMQCGYWYDDESLYEHALAVTKDNYVIHHNWGISLASSGHPHEGSSNCGWPYRYARIRPAISTAGRSTRIWGTTKRRSRILPARSN